jgi:hypothetical protein
LKKLAELHGDRGARLAADRALNECAQSRLPTDEQEILGAVQLLLGHTKIESTVRYVGIEVDDALAIAEQVDV